MRPTEGRPDRPKRRGAGWPQPLSEVDEEEVLRRIFPNLRTGPSVLIGPGDDAAVVIQPSGSVVATTDTMVRGQDWHDEWSDAHDVGSKLVTQNLADIAAMGAVATGVLVTLAADPQLPLGWAVDFADGVADTAAWDGVPVVGGDLSSAGAGTVMVSITALGDLQGRRPVLRSGARVGDVVAVHGSLGESGGGLELYLAGERPTRWASVHEALAAAEVDRARDHLMWVHRTPTCSVSSGPLAADRGATAMIDLSDGLARDAARIGRASGVCLQLSRSRLVADFVEDTPLEMALGAQRALHHVLTGGEEHSLLATFPANCPLITQQTDPDVHWWVIGEVVAATPDGAHVTLDGEPVSGGWDHFSG